MAKKRRTFTREFKVAAIKLITEQGYSYAEAARQLGILDNQLRQWKKQFDADATQAFPGQGNRSPLEAEVERLRVENKRLQLERDILKKATAFFAKEAT
jgi:transposase